MAKIKCVSGEILSNSSNPEIQFRVFSDDEWLTLIDRTEDGEKSLDFGSYRIHFWKCTNCSRLYFFDPQNDMPLQVYKVEIENRRERYPRIIQSGDP